MADDAGALIEPQIQTQTHFLNTNGKDEDHPYAMTRALAACKPRIEIPPGKTLFDRVAGNGQATKPTNKVRIENKISLPTTKNTKNTKVIELFSGFVIFVVK